MMNLFGPCSDRRATSRAIRILLALMLLGFSGASPCKAEDNDKTATKIKSWLVEPNRTQAIEDQINEWLKSGPKATKQIETIKDLADELRGNAPSDRPFDISVDLRGLEELGIDSADPIFADSVSPGSNLLLALQQHDLCIMVRKGVLEITTRSACDANPVRRIYDVTCLLSVSNENGSRTVNCGELLEVIRGTVEPGSWDVLGGTATIMPLIINQRCLFIVSTTSDHHQSLQALLDGLAIAGNVTMDDFNNNDSGVSLRISQTVRVYPVGTPAPSHTSNVSEDTKQ